MSAARRSLQVVAFICTLLVGVTSMVVIVTQTTWFKEWLRGFIVRQAEDYVNGRLSIGRLDGNLFSGIELGDLDIAMNGRSVVSVDQVGLAYNALTLIKGDVVLDHIRLDRPRLLVERTATGWSLTNLIKARTPDQPRTSRRTIEIGEIGISDGSFDVVDAVGTTGFEIPSRVDRLDASVAVKSSEDELKVDIAHVSFRAKDPELGLNALSGTIRRTMEGVSFENVSVRTEESSIRVKGVVTDLESNHPTVNVTATSDKLDTDELARVIPALAGYRMQPAFEVSAKGPSDRLEVKVNAREARLGQVAGDLIVNALDSPRRVEGTVSMSHFNVGPIAKSATLKSDITGQAKIDMTLPADGVPLRGTYAVNAEHAQVAGYAARNIVGNGRIDGNVIKLNVSAAAYGGHATARGIVRAGQPLALDLDGRASNVDLRNLPTQVNAPRVASNLNLEYRVAGRGSVYEGDVRLDTSTLAGATIGEGTTGHFRVGAGAPSYAAKGQVANLDVQQVGRGFEIAALTADRYRSRINATFDVTGEGGGRYPLTLDATGTVTDSEMFSASFPRLNFTTNLAGGDIRVKADGDFAKFDPAVVSGNERVAGLLNGELDVDTTIRQYAAPITPRSIDATGRVALAASRIAGVDIDTAMVDGSFANGEGTIKELSVVGADLTVTGKGPIVLNDTGNSNLELHVETPSIAKVGAIAGQQDLTGGAIVDATISGNAQKLTVWGNMHGSGLGKGQNNALVVDTTFDFTMFELDAATGTGHALTTATFVQIGGQKINGMYVDSTYGNSKLHFSVDAQQELRQIEIAGEVVFHPDHQEIHLPAITLRSQQIEWHTAPGSAAAIQYGKERIEVQDVTLVSGTDQRISADGVLGGPDGQAIRVRAENVDVASLNQLALGQPGQIAGRLKADAIVSGSTDAPRVAGEFTLAQGAFQMFRFDSLGGMVNYEPNGIDLDIRLQQNPTQWLTAKGRAPMSLFQPRPAEARDTHNEATGTDAVNIQVESSMVDLGVIQGFTSYVTNVTGTLQANFKVTGSGHDPHLDGAVDVRNGAFDLPDLGTRYTGLDTRIELTPEAVKISEMKIMDNHGSPLTVGGELAVHGRTVGGVQVTLQSEDFKVIDNELGNVRLDTDLRLTGEVRAPRLEGTIDVSTGTLDVARILERATADAYSTRPTELPFVAPEMAEETVRANAEIPADADTTKPGRAVDTAPNVTEVAQKTADAQPAATTTAVTSRFDAMTLDVQFSIPDDLVLKGQGLKASSGGTALGDVLVTVGGDVQVQKMPGDVLRVRGDVNTVRGSYTFQGRRFEIQRDGRIRFTGTDEIDPLLDIEAQRLISGVEAFIRVRGTMRQPELSFRSNPPLDEGDILSLIIFNQPINELGEGQQASLVQRAGDLASGYLASGLARSIGSALNLDEFELKAVGEDGAGPSVTVGQQVGRNLFFRVTQGFGDAQVTELMLEYQIAEFLRLQATGAQTEEGSARIRFNRYERAGIDLIFFFAF